jgi:hypothetical protein
MNFGLIMKDNSNGKNLHGEINVIFRNGSNVYQIADKGTVSVLAVSTVTGTNAGRKAVITTRADLDNLTTGASVGRNLDLTVQVFESTTTSGTPNQISIMLKSASGTLLFSSNWSGSVTNLQNLSAGTVKVRNSATVKAVADQEVVDRATTGDGRENLPKQPELLQNAPNPFSNSTRITYAVSERSSVRLNIFNSMGVRVATMEADEVNAGYHTVEWNTDDNNGVEISSGVYFYQLQTTSLANGAQFQETKKMMLAK